MTVAVDERGPVTIITIDRPEVRNAVDGPTAAALIEAFETFAARDEQRVAVLTGAHSTFCSGADLKALADDPARANRVEPDGPGPMGPTRMALDKPVLAAIEGYAVAGGLELALWCDLRIAAEDAILGFFDRRWGVPLIDGGTIRLPRLIGHSRAMDLLLTGRGVDAREAHSFGLVNRLAAAGTALETSVALAEQIAEFPQTCMVSDRASAVGQWGLDLDVAMHREFELGVATISSGETQAGAKRFAGGRGRHGDFTDL
ncbi:MAG TPA: crotonase/enoyl-CoA hydratase family protein [Actinomycetota bacterium]|nr:crotonase/enoyl-CoA hydratase family protein [Actinomycetota bacterium]